MSIASEIATLAANKAAIKAAIEAKNPSTMPTDALSQWPTSIASIGGGGHEGWIYGYVIDESDSNPATRVTYIEDNADFDPLYMDFTNDALVWGDWQDFVEEYFRPAMLKSDGTIDYYLDPNDLTKKADGVTASDVANTSYDGNAMLIVKPIYYNIKRSAAKLEVRFSNYKQNDDWYNWTHLKSDGTYADFCGWGLFEGSIVNSKLRSVATNEVPQGTADTATAYSYATANGSGWYTTTWADEMMMRLLFPLLCKSTNANACLGGATTAGSLTLKCGALKTKGAFWGHSASAESTAYGSKFLGIENVWGNRWRRPCGIVSINGMLYVKLTPSTVDGSSSTGFITSTTVSDYTSNYINSGFGQFECSSATPIRNICSDVVVATFPIYAYGSAYDSYYPDSHRMTYTNNPSQIAVGGSFYDGSVSGIFAQACDKSPNSYGAHFGYNISYHAS